VIVVIQRVEHAQQGSLIGQPADQGGHRRFITTNRDPTFPSEEGLIPGTGSMIAALEAASGVEAVAIGKPEPTIFQLAMAHIGARPETTATIGDRLDTDILGGRRAGLITICVLWGSDTWAEAEAFGPDGGHR
jgi:4-nitrophenyl phosphatase